MKAMILAAGEGTRFRPHTLDLPKPAIPFLNVPMGHFSLPWLKQAGVRSLVVNTFHLPEKVQALYKDQSFFDIEFSNEVGKILGSGGGLKNAQSLLGSEENFFLLNSDEIYLSNEKSPYKKLAEQHLRSKAISTLMVTEHPEVGSKFGGIWVNDKNKVIGFGKTKPVGTVKGYHYLGCQILNKKVFDYLMSNEEQNILYDGLTKAIQAGHSVELCNIRCEFFETGNLTDYLGATKQVLQHMADQTLEGMNFLELIQKLDSQSRLEKIGSALIWKHRTAQIVDCEIESFVVVGKNSKLVGCKLDQAVIYQGCSIQDKNFQSHLILK
jgi:mannose-1-phosphate guanylyltransferase